MKHLVLFFAISLWALHAGAQTGRKTKTINASISKNRTTSGDTTFFSNNDGTDLLRFFNRYLRIRFSQDMSAIMEYGSCTLYFIIDKTGKVTKSWCDSVTNPEVEKEVLRVAGKLPSLKPTTIKGKPVVTRVMATVIMAHASEAESQGNLKADIVVIGHDPAYNRATGR